MLERCIYLETHPVGTVAKLRADLEEALELLKQAYEATNPYIVHNVGVGEIRDDIQDLLAKHKENTDD